MPTDDLTEDGPAYEVMYLLDAEDDAVARLREELRPLGDSLVVVGGEGLWNVHVHVDDVGAAVEAGIRAGRPHRVRVTHFAEQVEQARRSANRAHGPRTGPRRRRGRAGPGPGRGLRRGRRHRGHLRGDPAPVGRPAGRGGAGHRRGRGGARAQQPRRAAGGGGRGPAGRGGGRHPRRGGADPRAGAGDGRAGRARAGAPLRAGPRRDDRRRPARPLRRGHRRRPPGHHLRRPVRARATCSAPSRATSSWSARTCPRSPSTCSSACSAAAASW